MGKYWSDYVNFNVEQMILLKSKKTYTLNKNIKQLCILYTDINNYKVLYSRTYSEEEKEVYNTLQTIEQNNLNLTVLKPLPIYDIDTDIKALPYTKSIE